MQAKHFSLPGGNLGQGEAELAGQLGLLGVLNRSRGRIGQFSLLLMRQRLDSPDPGPGPQVVECSHRGQPQEEGSPVVHGFATRDVERSEACFLKTVVGVCPVAQQAVGRLPGCRTVPSQDLLPVGHARLPSLDSPRPW